LLRRSTWLIQSGLQRSWMNRWFSKVLYDICHDFLIAYYLFISEAHNPLNKENNDCKQLHVTSELVLLSLFVAKII
ncbi:hypothetical protein, partial [Salmonella enterica]|uniref:hypothetical protein n=1 Tax=Salmonella enterica TaxID=28901 RepID=UPI0032990E10